MHSNSFTSCKKRLETYQVLQPHVKHWQHCCDVSLSLKDTCSISISEMENPKRRRTQDRKDSPWKTLPMKHPFSSHRIGAGTVASVAPRHAGDLHVGAQIWSTRRAEGSLHVGFGAKVERNTRERVMYTRLESSSTNFLTGWSKGSVLSVPLKTILYIVFDSQGFFVCVYCSISLV